jgi:hypothetical protein
MDRRAVAGNGGQARGDATRELSAADLFGLLWNALADLLGTAAAATLLRRAAQRAARSDAALADFAVFRESLEYRYKLPPSWSDLSSGAERHLRCLVAELVPLLVELTGPVVVRRIAQIPELEMWGIIPRVEEAP